MDVINKTTRNNSRVRRTHWVTLDQPSERCYEESRPDTTDCIIKFIEKTVVCSLPIYGANVDNRTKCDSNATLLQDFVEMKR